MMEIVQHKQRDITFDVMKGIGILLVLFGHVWELDSIDRNLALFRMPMFFIVAGYFSKSYNKINDVKGTIRRYAKRLWLPYLFVQIFVILWFCLIGGLKGDWNPAICEGLSLFWGETTVLSTHWGNLGIGVVWFVLALFWAKLIMLLLSKWEDLLLPMSLLIGLGALAIHAVFPYIPWCILLSLTALPFVCIGWFVRNHGVPLWIKIVCVFGWFSSILLKDMILDMYTYTWVCYPLNILAACGGTWCLYLLSRIIVRYMKRTSRILAQCGVGSLAIMCFHSIELSSHLGNHLKALAGLDFPVWGLYVWRYGITILLAIAAIHTPKLKKLFV